MATMTATDAWQAVYTTLSRELADLEGIAADKSQDEEIRDLARKDAEEVRSHLARATTIRQDPLFSAKPDEPSEKTSP